MNLTFVILAGGRGKRLGGTAKGLIQLGGRSIVQHLVEVSRPWPIFINANDPRPYADVGIPVVGDLIPGRGAPGGVVTALWLAQTPWVAVVACDMPAVTRAGIEVLMSLAEPRTDAVCYRRGRVREPLLGLYHKRLFEPWSKLLVRNPSMQTLLASAQTVDIDARDSAELDSINTPDDLERMSRSLGLKTSVMSPGLVPSREPNAHE